MQGRLNDHQGINSGAVHAMLKDSLTVNWHHLLYTFECVCRQARPANSTRYLLQFMLLYTSHFISREYCCNLIDELPPIAGIPAKRNHFVVLRGCIPSRQAMFYAAMFTATKTAHYVLDGIIPNLKAQNHTTWSRIATTEDVFDISPWQALPCSPQILSSRGGEAEISCPATSSYDLQVFPGTQSSSHRQM